MSAADYWREYVRPNLDDWRRNHLSDRHALNAAVALHHTADYVAQHIGLSIDAYRADLKRRNRNICILGDLVDTYKHCKLRDTSRAVFTRTAVEEIGGALSSSALSATPLSGGLPMLRVQVRGSAAIEFEALLDGAVKFWTAPTGEFARHSIVV
jgi:hypothetical protein